MKKQSVGLDERIALLERSLAAEKETHAALRAAFNDVMAKYTELRTHQRLLFEVRMAHKRARQDLMEAKAVRAALLKKAQPKNPRIQGLPLKVWDAIAGGDAASELAKWAASKSDTELLAFGIDRRGLHDLRKWQADRLGT